MSTSLEVVRRAAACAAKVREVADAAAFEPEVRALLSAVSESDARFAFDHEGRPGAIAAVRAALPVTERELLEAIIEDHACEIAALREAMFLIARAVSDQAPRADNR